MNDSVSEVARLRQQIENEYVAAVQGLHGLSIAAQHSFIRARMERVEQHYEALCAFIGEERAIDIVIEVNDAAVKLRQGSRS
ncbi:hypothetical protein EPA93_04555 [Ktedonosporobacter rubrisoli]|uniref:Uncharacterized protein n=1 Tax=Ktedonosporobacter rubrisoli TaxID=2509675 RepID=A0A4P6K525_KTERU|nr:hypothetical protein EPA93_04555 [Ktedonosporobacter rubrisoli]